MRDGSDSKTRSYEKWAFSSLPQGSQLFCTTYPIAKPFQKRPRLSHEQNEATKCAIRTDCFRMVLHSFRQIITGKSNRYI